MYAKKLINQQAPIHTTHTVNGYYSAVNIPLQNILSFSSSKGVIFFRVNQVQFTTFVTSTKIYHFKISLKHYNHNLDCPL